MNAKGENIDRFFKKKLENYEDTPGSVVWDNISEKLGHKKQRTLVLFMSRVAAGIALIVALGLGYYFLNKDSSEILTESSEQAGDQTDEKILESPGRLAESEAESEAITSTEKTPEPDLTKSVTGGLSAKTDNYKSLNTLSEIKSISVSKIDNVYAEDIKIAGKTEKKPAEEHFDYTGYIAEEEISLDDDKSQGSKWTVGGQLGPLYSYRNVSSDYLDSYVKDQINSKESGIITYALGLNVTMSPVKRFSIQSGIYYSKYGQQTDAVNIYTSAPEEIWGSALDEGTKNVLIAQSIGTVFSNDDDLLKFNQPSNEDVDNSNELRYFAQQTNEDVDVNATATQYFEYLEIPLIIKYKIIDRKIDLNVISGISTHFLIGNDIYLDYDNMYNRFPENVNVNNMNYSGSFGIGIEYPVLSKLMLNIEPRFKYYINPIVKNPSYNIYPYSICVFTGISYLF
jgi:hypothetical protein